MIILGILRFELTSEPIRLIPSIRLAAPAGAAALHAAVAGAVAGHDAAAGGAAGAVAHVDHRGHGGGGVVDASVCDRG
jgi:hypothetical protein